MCSCGRAVKGKGTAKLYPCLFTLDGDGSNSNACSAPAPRAGGAFRRRGGTVFFASRDFFFAKKIFRRRPQAAKPLLFSAKKTYQAERSRAW